MTKRLLLFVLMLMAAVCTRPAGAQTGQERGETLGGEACRAGRDRVAGRPVEIFCVGNPWHRRGV